MKILLVHNYYGAAAPSGENIAYEADRRLLRSAGNAVAEYTRTSDDLRGPGGIIRAAAATPWNPCAAAAVGRIVMRTGTEVVHVHNFFPLISPSVFRAARQRGAATVFTLHNARVFCAAGITLHAGKHCTRCLERRGVLPSLRNRCYRGSLFATLPLAAMIAVNRCRKTWERDVDAFIVFTGFQQALMTAAGIPADKVHVAPPCGPDPPAPVPFGEREEKAIFIGRLGTEKGVDVLLQAWRRWGAGAPKLEIVGEGPAGADLRRMAAALELRDRVVFSGMLTREECRRRLATARLLLLPSRCFEGFPMTLLEAMAHGVPMAGSRRGAVPWIIRDGETGALFEPGDDADHGAKVRRLWEDQGGLAAMAAAARAAFERDFTPAAAYPRLRSVYEAALGRRAAS